MKNIYFVQISKKNNEHLKLLTSLMVSYIEETDMHLGRITPYNVILKVVHEMIELQGDSDRHLELCYDNKNLIGFLYCKTDRKHHKGFIKPGYGYIMEFYVKPEYRRLGFGTAMFEHIEFLFALHEVKNMWLTADPVTGIPFWKTIGFESSGEISPENSLPILEKAVPQIEIKALVCGSDEWIAAAKYADKCSWKAGKILSEKMTGSKFTEWERVIAAFGPNGIAGYCTVSKTDCITDISYTPYIGFVFVGEIYRGNRLSQKLIIYAMEYLRKIGFKSVYLISDHIGLYEKYGFEVIDKKNSPWGKEQKIYIQKL